MPVTPRYHKNRRLDVQQQPSCPFYKYDQVLEGASLAFPGIPSNSLTFRLKSNPQRGQKSGSSDDENKGSHTHTKPSVQRRNASNESKAHSYQSPTFSSQIKSSVAKSLGNSLKQESKNKPRVSKVSPGRGKTSPRSQSSKRSPGKTEWKVNADGNVPDGHDVDHKEFEKNEDINRPTCQGTPPHGPVKDLFLGGDHGIPGEDSLCMRNVGYMGDVDFKLEKPVIEGLNSISENWEESLSEMISLIHKPAYNTCGKHVQGSSRCSNKPRARSRSRTIRDHANLDRMFADVFKNLVVQHTPEVTEDSYTATLECIHGSTEALLSTADDTYCHLTETFEPNSQMEVLYGIDGNNCHLSQGNDSRESSISDSPFSSKEDINDINNNPNDAQSRRQCHNPPKTMDLPLINGLHNSPQNEDIGPTLSHGVHISLSSDHCDPQGAFTLGEIKRSSSLDRIVNVYPPERRRSPILSNNATASRESPRTGIKQYASMLNYKSMSKPLNEDIPGCSRACSDVQKHNKDSLITPVEGPQGGEELKQSGRESVDRSTDATSSDICNATTATLPETLPRVVLSQAMSSNTCGYDVGDAHAPENNSYFSEIQTNMAKIRHPRPNVASVCKKITSTPPNGQYQGVTSSQEFPTGVDSVENIFSLCENIVDSLVNDVVLPKHLTQDDLVTSCLEAPRRVQQCRKNSSCHEDISSVSQSISCDVAHSETNVSEVMAIVSQEVNIKRYPSCSDLTELHDDNVFSSRCGGKSLSKAAFDAIATSELVQNTARENIESGVSPENIESSNIKSLTNEPVIGLPGVSRQDTDWSLHLPSPPTDSLHVPSSPPGSNSLDNLPEVMESLSGCASFSSSVGSGSSHDVNQSNQSNSMGHGSGALIKVNRYTKSINKSDVIRRHEGCDECVKTHCGDMSLWPTKKAEKRTKKKLSNKEKSSKFSNSKYDKTQKNEFYAEIGAVIGGRDSGELDTSIKKSTTLKPVRNHTNKLLKKSNLNQPQRCHRTVSCPQRRFKKRIRGSDTLSVNRLRTAVVTCRYVIRGPECCDSLHTENTVRGQPTGLPLLSVAISNPRTYFQDRSHQIPETDSVSSATLRYSAEDDQVSRSSSETLTPDITFSSSCEAVSMATLWDAVDGHEENSTMNSLYPPPQMDIPPETEFDQEFYTKSNKNFLVDLKGGLNINSNQHYEKAKNRSSVPKGEACSSSQASPDTSGAPAVYLNKSRVSYFSLDARNDISVADIAQEEDINNAGLHMASDGCVYTQSGERHRDEGCVKENCGNLDVKALESDGHATNDIIKEKASMSSLAEETNALKTASKPRREALFQTREVTLGNNRSSHQSKKETAPHCVHETTDDGKLEIIHEAQLQSRLPDVLQTSQSESPDGKTNLCDRSAERLGKPHGKHTKKIFNFASRSQFHVDRCDQILARSNRLIGQSEAMVASSRRQLHHVTRCLDRELPADDDN